MAHNPGLMDTGSEWRQISVGFVLWMGSVWGAVKIENDRPDPLKPNG